VGLGAAGAVTVVGLVAAGPEFDAPPGEGVAGPLVVGVGAAALLIAVVVGLA